MDNKVLSIDIEPSDLIKTIKEKIQVKLGCHVEEEILVFKGYCLDNNNTLVDYNIERDSTLHLLIKEITPINININVLGMKNFTIDIRGSEKIETLKNKISENIRTPFDKLILIYSNMILEDNNLIDDYNIKENSTIDCIESDYKINQIKIYVDINREKSIKIQCNPLDTILSIKYKIREKLGYSIDIQNLIYQKDIILANSKNLRDYNLEDNSIIFLELSQSQSQNLPKNKTIETKNNISNENTNDNNILSKSIIIRLRGPPNRYKKEPIIKDDSKIIQKILFEKIIE
jgi:ubiquitin C